jgi:dipeptidyl aminopeptidase/acylaminoacyl peptidase
MRLCRRLAALLLALATPLAATDSHPFAASDLVAMARLTDPRVSPDGSQVAFVLRTTDLAANRGRSDLWLVPLAGGDARRLTTAPENDTEPRWSPDGGSLFFLSSRSGSSQVWRLPLAGGEAEPVTDLPLPVANLLVSPDGSHLAFSLEVFPDCPTLDCTAARLHERQASPASGKLYDRLFVRHWDSWSDGRRSHLFVLPLAGGEPVDVSGALDADVPSKPFGGSEEFAFTPDGKEVVFAARVAGAGEPWSTNFDLYAAPIDGSAPPRNLTAANPAWDTGPLFSPDGRTLAYLATSRPGYESDRRRIVLRSWPGGATRVLTEGWDRSPDALVFSPDGRTLYATADDGGNVALFAVDVAGGAVRRLVADGHVRSPQAAGDRVVFGRDTFGSPVDLFSVGAAGGDLQRLTEVNAERLAAVRMGEAEGFTFAGANGDTVHAWLVKPVDFDPARRYPLAFLIHGGPQGSFSNEFHYRWNPQPYAGAGYAAVMVDFHGSTGYGQAFTDAIREDWGGKPLEDLERGLAATLARYPWIDGGRACALGASYGGYMINWIAGSWAAEGEPGPFRCLVDHDGVFDQRMMYYATEELWFPEWEHGGPYFANPEGHERYNPALHVDRWRTPMLVVHGALDFRIPLSQGLGTFTALQRRGVPSRLLVFPDENHWVQKPANSLLWHQTVLAWLARWTAPPAP